MRLSGTLRSVTAIYFCSKNQQKYALSLQLYQKPRSGMHFDSPLHSEYYLGGVSNPTFKQPPRTVKYNNYNYLHENFGKYLHN